MPVWSFLWGCYYLFLRAMRQQSGDRFGVYFERLARDRLEALQALFGFLPEEIEQP